jgi:hypothetical protein
LDNQILIPPEKNQYLSKEYNFTTIDEIKQYITRAKKENLDALFEKVKNDWKKYFDIDVKTLTLCAADSIFTYFQDKLGMTHYLLFVGDNNTGKSNALRIFHHLGYRPLFDVSITPANIYNFLGQFEEGQGIILEDEIDNIEEQEDKMKIYKTGYVSGAKVTRMYDSPNGNNKGKGQQRYNTFCFKAFSSERQPSYKAKGFSERIFTIKCSPGNPLNDISEVVNDAGDSKHKKLFREIDDLRKLLLVYRIIHYDDQIPDIHLSIKNRDKQLCKPVIRLFNNTKALEEIVASLTKFLYERYNKKLNSLDSYLFSVISDLVKDENTIISNEDLWKIVCCLPGSFNPYKPQSYQTDEFGNISKTVVTKICEDKFGAHKEHDGEKRSLVFNKTILQKLKDNYSTVKKIEILDNNSAANTPNTFNTFWKGIERNGTFKNNFNVIELTKSGLKLDNYADNSESFKDNSSNSPIQIIEVKDEYPTKVLEVLEVLENGKQLEDRIEHEIEIYNQQDDYISSNKSCLFECYYCDVFTPTDNEDKYLKHVVLNHNNKPAYLSMADLNKNNIKPQGKK